MNSEESMADSTVNYEVSGDMTGTYTDLPSAFVAINADSGINYAVTADGDDQGATAFMLKAGKKVTLTSSSGDLFRIIFTKSGRLGTVNGNLTLENIIMDGNSKGSGIMVNSSGTLNMNSGSVIQNCYISGYGGGVYNSGTFNMYGGAISNNSSSAYGGGVYNEGTFNMYGGVISDNSSIAYGGGVYSAGATAVFNMLGDAIISGNSTTAAASYGGGVANVFGSVFNMQGHSIISGNEATFYAGGVINWMNSTFTMSDDASIFDNTVTTYGNYGGGVTNHTANFYMSGNAVIYSNEATYGGGVFNIDGAFYMSGHAKVSNNNATARGGGVYNNSYDYETTFSMSGNAEICCNTVTASVSYGGGVFNGSRFGNPAIFTMSDNAAIHDNTIITDTPAGSYGGGVFINTNTTFNMLGGEIYDNSSDIGGGISNSGIFTMDGGTIRGNTAGYGGGIYNTGKVSITSGEISENIAKSTGTFGSGGGIYTIDFGNLTVADVVVFSGNSAPTLRATDIDANADIDGNGVSDSVDYAGHIGNVLIYEPIPASINAPAYNNYDINYTGDVYVVFISIVPDGAGAVTVVDTDSGTEYGALEANGYVHVPTTVSSITLAATAVSGYEFSKFVIGVTTEISDDQTIILISGNISVVAEFINKSITPPVKPPVNYTITATADNGSTISPDGKLTVVAGGSITFGFSAKYGYAIVSVYVDGTAISQNELASGTYSFRGVNSNHTIAVVSEADKGGTIGSGDSKTGEGSADGGERSEWAVMNLICAVFTLLAGIIAVIVARNNRREEGDGVSANEEDERPKASIFLGITALILGIVSVIIFFLTEDWTLPMTVIDRWTLLMVVLLIAAIIVAVIGLRSDEEEEEIGIVT